MRKDGKDWKDSIKLKAKEATAPGRFLKLIQLQIFTLKMLKDHNRVNRDF